MKNEVFFEISSISPIFFKIFALPGQEGGGEGDDGDDELHDDTGMGVWDALCRGMGHNDIYTRLSRPSSGCVLVRSNCGGDIWRESS